MGFNACNTVWLFGNLAGIWRSRPRLTPLRMGDFQLFIETKKDLICYALFTPLVIQFTGRP